MICTTSKNHIVSTLFVYFCWEQVDKYTRGKTRTLYRISRAVWDLQDWLLTNQIAPNPVCMSWSYNNVQQFVMSSI